MLSDNLEAILATTTHSSLAHQLFEEETKLEEAFALRKWQHTELDGGRFAEVAARILYGIDSGKFNLSKGVDDCLKYVDNDSVSHSFPDAKSANQIALILRSIYKLRSQRGAVHVSPTYTANEIDSRLVVEGARWVLAEILRVFVTTDQAELVAAIEELSRFPQTLIRDYGDIRLLQAVNFTVEEEVLVHLLHERAGISSANLIRAIPRDPSGIRRAIRRLEGGNVRQIIQVGSDWVITDLGIVRIESRIAGS